jgi:CRISPR-associated protein Csx3
MISLKLRSSNEQYQVIDIELDGDGVCSPEDLPKIDIPESKIDYKKGVVLSGRAPIWVYGYLIHELHPAAWLATYDPRLGGFVVVESHIRGTYHSGDLVQVKL